MLRCCVAQLTELIQQPLIAFNQLIKHCKVMSRRLVRHHPASCHYLQTVLRQQPSNQQLHNNN